MEKLADKITVENIDRNIKFKLTRRTEVYCEQSVELLGYEKFALLLTDKIIELKNNNEFLECEIYSLMVQYSFLYTENRK